MRRGFICCVSSVLVLVFSGCSKSATVPTSASEDEKPADQEEMALLHAAGGKLDVKATNEVLRAQSKSTAACLEEYANSHGGTVEPGRIVFKITVGPDGRAATELLEDSYGDGKLASCIASSLEALDFPKPEGGPASFHLPFSMYFGEKR